MRTYAITCFLVAAIAESVGLLLVLLEFRESRRTIREWIAANPKNNAQGSNDQILLLNGVILGLLGSAPRRVIAALLIGLGIVAGTLGNFTGLPD